MQWERNKRGEKTLRGVKIGHVDKEWKLELKEFYIHGGH